MNPVLRASIPALACLLAAAPVAAQDDTTSQVWFDYHAHYFTSDEREIYGDAGARFQADETLWQQYYVRPSLRLHRRGGADLHAGVGLFGTRTEVAPSWMTGRTLG